MPPGNAAGIVKVNRLMLKSLVSYANAEERRPGSGIWKFRTRWAAGFFLLWLIGSSGVGWALGQVLADPLLTWYQTRWRYQLSENPQLELIDGQTQLRLSQVPDFLAEGHWQEAIDILQRYIDDESDRLVSISPRRLLPVAEYCRIQLSKLPPEALAVYRQRVDPLAQRWFESAISSRDWSYLERIVEKAYASRWTARALLLLGDLRLEDADPIQARYFWEQCIPIDRTHSAGAAWLCVPESDVALAGVRARLILAEILHGEKRRAEELLELFQNLHGEATGPFAGSENASYVTVLKKLLAEMPQQPAHESGSDWTTFGGGPTRQVRARVDVPAGPPRWRTVWQGIGPGEVTLSLQRKSAASAGDSLPEPPSVHPVIVGRWLLANNQAEIWAWELGTGQPAWAGGPTIYRDPYADETFSLEATAPRLGIPRFTLTAHGNRVFAKMGSPTPGFPPGTRGGNPRTSLVCLDLASQGRLVWKLQPEQPTWAFEGSPACDGQAVYVLVRRSEVQPQLWLAAYEASRGTLLWQRFIAGGESLGRNTFSESSHLVPTLYRDTIYVTTNLGVIAAISTKGRLRWVATYPRGSAVDLTALGPHWFRDPNAPLFHEGILYVAPADTPSIIALDAQTGQALWWTGEETATATQLLGVAYGRLIAGGGKLFWIGTQGDEMGRVVASWPQGGEPLGCGRGLLARDQVLWPGKEGLFVFDQRTARLCRIISLGRWHLKGGNLAAGSGYLVLATGREIAVFGPGAPPPGESAPTHLAGIH